MGRPKEEFSKAEQEYMRLTQLVYKDDYDY